MDNYCNECKHYVRGGAHNSYCSHEDVGEYVNFEEGLDTIMCCDYFELFEEQSKTQE